MSSTKDSIPKDMSFEPEVVEKEIARLERIASSTKLSETERHELALLKSYEAFLKEKTEME